MARKILPRLVLARLSRKQSGGFLGLTMASVILVVLFLHAPRVAMRQTTSTQTTAVQQWSVGYYTPNGFNGGPWLPPAAIEWGGLTHVIYWGGIVNSNGTLNLTAQQVAKDGPTLISNAHAHGVKVLLGLLQSNWTPGNSSTDMQSAVTNNLSEFVANVMSAVNNYGFDGVDVDWEPFNADANGAPMTSLVSALRTALGTGLLTAAAIDDSYGFWGGSVQNYMDRISIMTYDMHNSGQRYSWFNSALYGPSDQSAWSVDLAVSRFINAGVPAAKLGIGIPFYGWKWQGGGITGPKQNWFTKPGLQQIYYQSLASMITPQNYHWDPGAQVPYLSINSGPGQFITYDDAQSIAAKIDYAKSKGLGGWIIWELVGDYLPGQTPNQPLLTAIKNKLGGLKALSVNTPGLFEFSPGVVAAQDTSFNGIGPDNPAIRGQTIAIYANNLGPVTNPPAAGQVALPSPLSETISTPTVTIGGQQAVVSFSGLSAGWAALYQINVVVPQSLSPGNYPISLSIQGQTSNTSEILVQ